MYQIYTVCGKCNAMLHCTKYAQCVGKRIQCCTVPSIRSVWKKIIQRGTVPKVHGVLIKKKTMLDCTKYTQCLKQENNVLYQI